jgi:hypothetical protein
VYLKMSFRGGAAVVEAIRPSGKIRRFELEMRRCRLNFAQLGRAIQVPGPTLAHLRAGRTGATDGGRAVLKLARFFNLTPRDVLAWVDDPIERELPAVEVPVG